MNAQAFLELINKADNLDNADLKKALKLQEEFPYFLAPKVLAAKYEWDKASGESQTLLHWAAVVSPERKRLKSLLTGTSPIVPASVLEDEITKASIAEITVDEPIVQQEQESKVASADTPPLPVEKPIPAEGKSSENISRPKRDEILRRLEENLKKINKVAPANPDGTEDLKKKAIPEKINEEKDTLINKASTSPEKTVTKKLNKDQQELIDKFKEKPIRLKREKMDEIVELPDLSEKSTLLNNSMVSESYAKLLAKQNKNKEAIEIYQKLILNFPKKKAFFADQIENLKE
ncbi:hypothetical protein [Cyclobacterium qasimii]|uniref:Uncharacterized protein n=2 Tax=Cyclobacterium qasimii TaxID=1350429 RepID=S7VJX1_9BACT|nr:hypothetical protein [Cyclobacterium qasimii]EPR70510.1 hypothetical protein ADICYQ_0934 [Cyclobacterium qasimii M12-11B]GEO22302.1 hypothetical protein CQA01_28360 [Cyclobacterium qasimii]